MRKGDTRNWKLECHRETTVRSPPQVCVWFIDSDGALAQNIRKFCLYSPLSLTEEF